MTDAITKIIAHHDEVDAIMDARRTAAREALEKAREELGKVLGQSRADIMAILDRLIREVG